MPKVSANRQASTILHLLLALLTDPQLNANDLAKVLDVTPNHIAKLVSRFREFGLDIEYDFKARRYVGKFQDQLKRSVLGPFAKKLSRVVQKSAQSRQQIRFVETMRRYSVPQFAEHLGTTPQNVYNMISGYKGQHLPAGWVAYQTSDAARWILTKASASRDGKRFTLPESVRDIAAKWVMGSGEPTSIRDRSNVCAVEGCGLSELARGLCNKHYYDARRHPDKYKGIIEKKK